MAYDKIVDSAQLDGAIAATADAIRSKTGWGYGYEWDMNTGFKGAISSIPAGTNLNFEVVGGTTQPANPKENTIWVNTSADITSWVFSAETPTSPANGTVWVRTVQSGEIGLNVLKQNEINIFLAGVRQYLSGTWATKTAAVFSGNTWNSLDLVLYVLRGSTVANVAGDWVNVANVNLTADGLAATANTYNGNMGYFSSKIDVTDYRQLTFNFASLSSNTTVYFYVGLSTTPPVAGKAATNGSYFVAYARETSGPIEMNISLENVTGEYYVAITSIASFIISEIKLSK